jgi:hypothetical protein
LAGRASDTVFAVFFAAPSLAISLLRIGGTGLGLPGLVAEFADLFAD